MKTKIRKPIIGIALILFVSLLAGSCSATGQIASDAREVLQINNTITVQGASSVTVTPTIAYVNIGVATFNKEAAIAQSDNAEKMEKVYSALDSLGITKDQIKTVTYNISSRYDYSNDTSTLAGYDVINGIQVTVMDLTKVSDVLDMTVKQGVNQANSISFSITDQERNDFYLQALSEAVADAKGKASALATAAGVTVTDPIQIIEGTQENVVPIYSYSYDTVKEDAASTPISGGELKVEATVTLVYSY